MGSKYGLHKKISFIFEGDPAEGPADQPADAAPALSDAPAPENTGGPALADPAPAAPNTPAPAVKPAPVAGVRRARKKDPRQTRMIALIAVLAPVFCVVLMLSLQSPKPIKAAASTLKADSKTAANLENGPVQAAWAPPEPWPDFMRDPMQAGKAAVGETPAAFNIVVKGIVFSAVKPSAIIGEEIVFEGSVVNGATVRKIQKECIEFERDGKTWTQTVQR